MSRAVGLEKLDILVPTSENNKKRKTTLETSEEEFDKSQQFSDIELSQEYFSFLNLFKNPNKTIKLEKIKKIARNLIGNIHSSKLLSDETKAMVRNYTRNE